MRVKTEIFASALVRRVFSRGDFAAVEKKGAEEAGAVFVRQIFRDGTESLHAPAPQSFFDAEESAARLFETRLTRGARENVSEALERERRFDSDLWVIAIESDDIADLLDFGAAEQKDDGFFRR
jgi:hypothetical protein